jgi:nitroimidazol reductase NimA-like FMN-containing flavoprotein (pyridoxamine 5'-phosphate oxidase superfamily)
MILEKLTEAECLGVLARGRLGRLACARENQPYIVPIYFAYQQPYVYAFTTPGKKVEWMRDNPRVCLEVDGVEDTEHWMSVIVFGRYEELGKMPEWEDPSLRAVELLNKDAGWWEPGCASNRLREPAPPLTPVFYRIRIDRISGRRATPNPSSASQASTCLPTRGSQGWLRTTLHVLAKPFVNRGGMRRCGPVDSAVE